MNSLVTQAPARPVPRQRRSGELLDQADRLQRDVLLPKSLTPSGLSTREIDVLRLVAQGPDLAETADTNSYEPAQWVVRIARSQVASPVSTRPGRLVPVAGG
ncbi:hypothetical protein ACIQVK_51390 [Streptomyces sp. NPDC090493]|uniref:hypothetical protein n=1 Tax=Streptomyces sp. NPDC090493 TaxID=3365964 RepID=UPI0037F41992